LDTFARLVRLHRSKDRLDAAFFNNPLLVLYVVPSKTRESLTAFFLQN